MKISRIYDRKAQLACMYQYQVEIGFEALDQCIANGYDGYDLRWHLAWTLADQAVEMCIIARHVAGQVNDIFDLEERAMPKKLKKCPYSHNGVKTVLAPVVKYRESDRAYFVECPYCGGRGPVEGDPKEAVKAWEERK